MKNSVANTYDRLAKSYEEHVDLDSPHNTDYERPAMMNLVPESLAGLHVLDAGCAAGWYSENFINRGAHVTALDISPKMVEATERRLKGKGDVFCHDLSKSLPFQDNEFDWIVSSLTLHYLENWEHTFSEINRVLKPNGHFLFSVHHPYMDFTKFQCEDYFQTILLKDTWKKPNITIDVQFYRRPLQNILNETTRFFELEKLMEPQPVESLKDKEPKAYNYLMKNPHFLMIKAKSKKKG